MLKQIDILTLFPNMFNEVFQESMLKIAQDKKKITLNIHNIREYTKDPHKKVDDRPYGGGPGMVMSIQPIYDALRSIKKKRKKRVIFLTPDGVPFNQKKAQQLLKYDQLLLLCGHYEGIDERIREHLVDEEISIGDYVLTGGEVPAMVIVDAVTRLLPGVLGDSQSLQDESFNQSLLDYPHYTRPQAFKGWKVPEVLASGDHKKISEWRKQHAHQRTVARRPDILKKPDTRHTTHDS